MSRLFFAILKPIIRFLLFLVYHPRVIDAGKVPASGGLLLVCNHVSFLDPVLLYCSQKRNIVFIADENFVPKGYGRWAAKMTGTVLFRPGSPRSVVEMLRKARAALARGEVVCVFPEGGITRTGQLKGFEPGVMALLKGNPDVPVQPAYIGGMWGSVFGYSKKIYNSAGPHKMFQRVTIAFGDPVRHPRDAFYLRHLVEELGVDAMDFRRFPRDRHYLIPVRQMLRNLRGKNCPSKVYCSTGMRLNARQLRLRLMVARRVFHKVFKGQEMVGLLLPTSGGGAIANAALTLDRKIPVNLNYTMGNDTLDYCCDLTGIAKVLTSRKFLAKFPKMKLKAEWVLAEDVLKKIPLSAKLLGLVDHLLPTWLVERYLGLNKVSLNDVMTIVFTSGSTGRPKGAMLSHGNIASNIHQFYRLYAPTPDYKILGALPFFHSFGFTTTIWCPFMCPFGVVYHYSPLDAKVIGELAMRENVLLMPSTATFYKNYIRRCPKEHFEKMPIVVAGAEKLPSDLAEAWKEKYGQELLEGFGATELSPVLASSLAHSEYPDTFHIYQKPGSIGVALGGTAVRIVDPDTGELLPADTPGMMEVKGPTVMLGYYKNPEMTAKVIKDGWYSTGDIAKIDNDGFIYITGRLSRISKIGGEMVPHAYVEEEIERILRRNEESADTAGMAAGAGTEAVSAEDVALRMSVTAVPDEKKGERLVVLYTDIPVTPESICEELKKAGLPQIWIPAAQDFHQVPEIPLLGTGKPSLREIKDIALGLYGIKYPE